MAGDFSSNSDPNLFGSPTSQLPTMSPLAVFAGINPYPAADPSGKADRGIIMPGIRAGIKEGVGALGSVAGAIGNVTGIQPLRSFGEQLADRSAREAQEVGRPDLEGNPFTHGLDQVLPRLGYQVAKMAPSLGMIAATAPAIPEELVAGLGLRALGKVVPRVLGGGAGLAADEAAKVGAGWGANVLAGTAVMAPQQVAGMYSQAREAAGPEGPSATSAALALGAGVPLGALASIAPAGAGSLLKEGLAGKVVARMATAGGANAAAGAIQGGISTGVDQMFGPDIPMAERMKNVVDSAMTGAAMGGFLGLAGGIRRENPANVSTDALKKEVDSQLGLPGVKPSEPAAAPLAEAPPAAAPRAGTDPAEPVLPGIAVDDKVQAMRDQLRKQAGLADKDGKTVPALADHPDAAFVNGIQATSRPEARIAIEAKLAETDKPAGPLKALGVEYGLLDAKGNPRDLDADLNKARDALAELNSKAVNNPGIRPKITAADNKVTDIRQDIAERDEAEKIKAAQPSVDESAKPPVEEPVAPAPTPKAETPEDTIALVKELNGKVPAKLRDTITSKEMDEADLLEYMNDRDKEGAKAPSYVETLRAALDARAKVRETENAPEEPSPESVDAQPAPGDGRTLGEGDASRAASEALGNGEVVKAQDAQVAKEAIPVPDQVETAIKADIMAKAGSPAFEAAVEQADIAASAAARRQNGKTAPRQTVQPPPANPFAMAGEQPQLPPGMKPNVLPDERTMLTPEAHQDFVTRLQQAVDDPDVLPVFRSSAEAAINGLKNNTPGAAGTAAMVLARYEGVQITPSLMAKPGDAVRPPMGAADFEKALMGVSHLVHPDRMNSVLWADHPGELPPEVIQQGAKQGMGPDTIRGAYYQGKMYGVRSAMKGPEDVQELVLHEVQHAINKSVLGPDYEDVMARIFDKAGGSDGILATARRFGPDVEKQLRAYLPDGPISSRDKAAFADEMFAQVAGKATGKFKMALMAWAGDVKTALLNFMRDNGMTQLANKFDKFTAADVAKFLRDSRQADAGLYSKDASDAAFLKSTPGMTRSLGNFEDTASKVERFFENHDVGFKHISDLLRAKSLFWMAPESIRDLSRKLVPSIDKQHEAQELTDGLHARGAQTLGMTAKIGQAFREAGKKNGGLQDRMLSATEHGIDPSKPWAAQPHLFDRPRLKPLVDALHNEFNSSFRQAGGIPVYNQLREGSMAQMHSEHVAILQNAMLDAGMTTKDIAREFRDNVPAHEDQTEARKFWESKFTEQTADIASQSQALRAEASIASKKERRAILDRVTPVEGLLSTMRDRVTKATAEPYFHLGRSGDYVVSGKIRTLEDGVTPDPKAIAAVQAAFEKAGFDGISVNQNAASNQIFSRFENRDVGSRAYNALADLQKTGEISNDEGSLWQGPRENLTARQAVSAAPQLKSVLDGLESRFKSDESTPEGQAQAAILKQVRALVLDIVPDKSLVKVMTERKGVQGYATNMLTSYVQRGQTSARAVAHLLTADEHSKAISGMINEVKALRTSGASDRDIMAAHQVVTEVLKERAAAFAESPRNSALQTLGAMTHAWALGFSPAYTALVMSQNWTLGLPELAKHSGIGFVAAAKAIAGNTSIAFKIMTAVARSSAAGEGTITSEALKGIPKGTADFIMQCANRNWIEIGGFTRTMGTRAAGGAENRASRMLRLASMTAGYSENLSRIISVLAARDVYKGPPEGLMDFVGKSTKTSMMVWGGANNPRAFGPQGVLGPYSPLATKFMGYQMRLIPLLYKNVLEAFHGNGATETEVAEARKFLLGHLAMTIALGGLAGLPAAGVFAGVATRVSGMLNQGESFDVEQHIRNFFTEMFGEDAGQAMTDGLPRLAGLDMAHFSDGEMAPFTRILTDRRKMEDALPDWAEHALGAPFGMSASMYLGFRDLVRGVNPLIALQNFLPSALRNPYVAYRMSTVGYVDRSMNKLPIDPTAEDILAKAIGFTPGRQALESERSRAQSARKEEMTFRSSVLMKNYAIAVEQHNPAAQAAVMAQIHAYDADPAHAGKPLAPNIGAFVRRRAQEAAQARTSGLPFGVPMNDLGARQLTPPRQRQ